MLCCGNSRRHNGFTPGHFWGLPRKSPHAKSWHLGLRGLKHRKIGKNLMPFPPPAQNDQHWVARGLYTAEQARELILADSFDHDCFSSDGSDSSSVHSDTDGNHIDSRPTNSGTEPCFFLLYMTLTQVLCVHSPVFIPVFFLDVGNCSWWFKWYIEHGTGVMLNLCLHYEG